eukprot:m51a1_g10849 hypothetical protein (96) ;mRNA; f:5078-5431
MDPQLLHDQILLRQHDTFARIASLQWAAFEKARRQYLAKKRGRLHFDGGDYVLLDKDRNHKLDINVRGPFCVIEKLDHHCYTIENLLRGEGIMHA